jgi:hypothetical protein
VANIAVHGQRLNLSVSIGVSNSPADGVTSAGALIELAGARLKAAQQAGGNRVIAGRTKSSGEAIVPRLDRAVALINSGRDGEVVRHLAALGSQVLPLLKLLDREFKWGLPMADIERGMPDPARKPEDARQE